MPQATPTLVLTPLRQAAPAAGGTLDVLVRVQAPPKPQDAEATPRLPLRLAVVVDRSGSMSGAPLREALRCTEYIAARLQPDDRLAVVLYDQEVQVLQPLAPPDKHALHAALRSIESGGNTGLFAGWAAGAQCLQGADAQSISRVILLSDGQANVGTCDAAEIARHCAARAATGVSTTTVGLGADFNENLMIAMARAGRGKGYYGQTAEDLHDSFDEELALLQAIFLRGLQLKLLPGSGVVFEPLGVVHRAANGGCDLQDLAWEAEAWMLVRLHLAPAGAGVSPADKQALLAVALTAHDERGEAIELSAVLSLPLLSPADLAGMPQDETVAQRVQEMSFVAATGQVRELAQNGRIEDAKVLLARLEAQVADNPWLAHKIALIKEMIEQDTAMFAKEALYTMNHAATRLYSPVAEPYTGSETDRDDIPAYLRRKSSQGKGRQPRS